MWGGHLGWLQPVLPESQRHSGDGPKTPQVGCLRSSGLASVFAAFWFVSLRNVHLGPGDICPFSNSDSSF